MRFVINTQHGPRSLFTVSESKDGYLAIASRGGDLRRVIGRDAVQPGPTPKGGRGAMGIHERKISIHPSARSESGNTIHFTIRTEDNKKIDRHHFTRAIKGTNRFAPVLAHQFGTLSHQQNEATKKRETLCLGEYDDGLFTIMTLLLVSARDRVFEAEADDFNYVQRNFKLFSLTLLWSFAFLPPRGNHNDIVPSTAPPDPETAINPREADFQRKLMQGLDEADAVELFKSCRDVFREELLAVIRNGPPPSLLPGAEELVRRQGYYKEGKVGPAFDAEFHRRTGSTTFRPSSSTSPVTRAVDMAAAADSVPYRSITCRWQGEIPASLNMPCAVGASPADGVDAHRGPFREYMAMWATGATRSAITQRVIDECGLEPIGRAVVLGAHGAKDVPRYRVDIMLPNNIGFPDLEVTPGEFGDDVDVVIGLDIITRGDFAITCPGDELILSFRSRSIGSIDFVAEDRRSKEGNDCGWADRGR